MGEFPDFYFPPKKRKIPIESIKLFDLIEIFNFSFGILGIKIPIREKKLNSWGEKKKEKIEFLKVEKKRKKKI